MTDDQSSLRRFVSRPVSRYFRLDWQYALRVARVPMLRPASLVIALISTSDRAHNEGSRDPAQWESGRGSRLEKDKPLSGTRLTARALITRARTGGGMGGSASRECAPMPTIAAPALTADRIDYWIPPHVIQY